MSALDFYAGARAYKRELTGDPNVRLTDEDMIHFRALEALWKRDDAPRRASQAGIDLIHSFESCKLEAYPDPGSKDGHPWTIGWGSTGADIVKGLRWTPAQCDERFKRDLAKFEDGVSALLGVAPTKQSEFDALVSFAYNVGLGALKSSTLLRLHKAGDNKGAADQFQRWNKNDGKVMRGLTRRRAAEADLYRGQS